MASIHVISGASNVYTVIVHAAVPAGNNAAGVPWSTALKNSGKAVTIMTVGTGPGQITNTESNAIANGTIMEGVFQWGDNPAWTNAERVADLNLRAQQLMAELQAKYAEELKYFGFTQG